MEFMSNSILTYMEKHVVIILTHISDDTTGLKLISLFFVSSNNNHFYL